MAIPTKAEVLADPNILFVNKPPSPVAEKAVEVHPLYAHPPAASGGEVAFNPKPLTAGIHQRSDDSYFRVHHMEPEPGVAVGWYWDGCDEDGVWDGDWISGPYPTVEKAAEAGWYSETTHAGNGGQSEGEG